MNRLPVVKEEYEDLPTPLDEWDPLTEHTFTNSSPQLSTTTTESVSNQHSLTVTTPNDSITIPTTTSRASDNDKTRSSMASVHESPKVGEGLEVQRSNRPFIINSNNKVTSNSLQAQQNDTEFPFDLELHFKQTQEQLKEYTAKLVENANQTLQKKYDELQLDYFEFKTNANLKLAKLETLQMENARLNDKVNQLKDEVIQLKDQLTNTSQVNSHSETSRANAQFYTEQDHFEVDATQQFQNEGPSGILPQDESAAQCNRFVSKPICLSTQEQSTSLSMPLCSVQSTSGTYIKQEYLDDNDDSDTNASNVTLDIKTEAMDCDFEIVKDEIKEEDEDEDDHDVDCDGCDRCLVKRELVSDDELDERYEVIQPHVDNDDLLCSPSRDSQNVPDVNESMDEAGANLWHEQQTNNTLNEPNERTVTQSGDLFSPSSSTGQDSIRTDLTEQATLSTQHNHNKRKQSQLKRTGKRSKKTIEEDDGDDEDGEDIANEDRVEGKIKVLYLNCTQPNCDGKLDTLDQYYGHLRNKHGLAPFQCFCGCKSRFDESWKIPRHHDRSVSKFSCSECSKVFSSQRKTSNHWYQNH